MTSQIDRKNIIQVVIIILICLTAIVALFYLGAFKPPIKNHNVTFHVNASGGYALITLKTPKESITAPTIVTTPWRVEMTLPRGSEVYLTAANPTQTGELTCKIFLEKQIWKSMEKDAPENGIACAGIIP